MTSASQPSLVAKSAEIIPAPLMGHDVNSAGNSYIRRATLFDDAANKDFGF